MSLNDSTRCCSGVQIFKWRSDQKKKKKKRKREEIKVEIKERELLISLQFLSPFPFFLPFRQLFLLFVLFCFLLGRWWWNVTRSIEREREKQWHQKRRNKRWKSTLSNQSNLKKKERRVDYLAKGINSPDVEREI